MLTPTQDLFKFIALLPPIELNDKYKRIYNYNVCYIRNLAYRR